jgi:hypothetical protein
MQLRRIKTATALLATAAGVAAFAGSAQAAVVDNYGFDMSGNPDLQFRDGNMAFDWEHSVTSGHLTGTLKVIKNGDNARFRVALRSEDGHGTQLGATVYDNEAGTLVRTTGSKDIPVDMDATVAAGVRQVKVLLQKQVAGGSFVTKDYTYATVLTHSDDVTILGSGIDVGGPGFANHAPTGPASVWWTFEDDGQLTAHLTATLHLDHGFYPGRGRIVIRALNNAGKVLATDESDECKPKDLGYLACDYQDLSVTTADAIRLKVTMQTSDGSTDASGNLIWTADGDQIVNVAE